MWRSRRALGNTGSGVATISTSYFFSCAVTTGGAAYCWGWNGYGELGDGTNTNSNVPVAVRDPA